METNQELETIETNQDLVVVEEYSKTVGQMLVDTAATVVVGMALATVVSYGTQFTRKVIDGQTAKIQKKFQEKKASKETIIIDQQP